MDLLYMKHSLDKMLKASCMRWYGHIWKKENESVIVKALKFEVRSNRGRAQAKQT